MSGERSQVGRSDRLEPPRSMVERTAEPGVGLVSADGELDLVPASIANVARDFVGDIVRAGDGIVAIFTLDGIDRHEDRAGRGFDPKPEGHERDHQALEPALEAQ